MEFTNQWGKVNGSTKGAEAMVYSTNIYTIICEPACDLYDTQKDYRDLIYLCVYIRIFV